MQQPGPKPATLWDPGRASKARTFATRLSCQAQSYIFKAVGLIVKTLSYIPLVGHWSEWYLEGDKRKCKEMSPLLAVTWVFDLALDPGLFLQKFKSLNWQSHSHQILDIHHDTWTHNLQPSFSARLCLHKS